MTLKEIVILVGLIAVVSGKCLSSSDCPSNECCVLGEGRDSQPKCSPRGAEGDICRPGPPITENEFYVGDRLIPLHNVYSRVCPCKQDLFCNKHDGVCSS